MRQFCKSKIPNLHSVDFRFNKVFTEVPHCLLRDQGNWNFTNSHNSNRF